MKKEDNITQLYKNAFTDFSVSAPDHVYAKVQSDLKRKKRSLLTLDPTRLNVFYLALLSGIVAWALTGEPSGNATLSNSNELQNTDPLMVQTAIDSSKGKESVSSLAPVSSADDHTSDITNEAHNEVNSLIGLDSSDAQEVKNNSTQTTHKIPRPRVSISELSSIFALAESMAPAVELKNNKEIVNDYSAANYNIDPTQGHSLEEVKVEDPADFMRAVGLDKDKKVDLTIRTKKK